MSGLFTTSADSIPLCRVQDAVKRGVEKNILFCVGGGIGDMVCAEPTLRYALSHFKECEISLFTRHPELFSHLKFENVFGKLSHEEAKKYFCIPTYPRADDFSGQFYTPNSTNAVDFCSLQALRAQLPCASREIHLTSNSTWDLEIEKKNPIIVHPGRTWPSRTFPTAWWDCVLAWLIDLSLTPILIGTLKGTVDVGEAHRCIDLRDKLTLSDSIRLLQSADVVLTNDSSPLHMAASRDPARKHTGRAWINFIATARHPDFLKHFRHGEWGYRMVNHSKGGLWQKDVCPNKTDAVEIMEAETHELISWLPDPQSLAETLVEQLRQA